MKSPREILPSLLHATRHLTGGMIGRPGIRVREAWAYILAFALAVVTVGVFLSWHIASLYEKEMASWRTRQSSMADERAQRVSGWLDDGQVDAQLFATHPSVRNALRAHYDTGQPTKYSPGSLLELTAFLDEMAKLYTYAGVYILDRDAQVVAQSSGGKPLNPLFSETCRAVASSEVMRVAVVGDAPARSLMGFSAPVFPGPNATDAGRRPGQLLGIVLLVSDVPQTLFPIVTQEGTPTRTGETLLVRREGNDIVYFSPLRHVPAGSPNLRVPLSAAPRPARLALEGRTTFGEYNDYRGVPVLATTQYIPLTGWGMVRKIDRSEALGDFRKRVATEGLAAGLLIILLGGLLVFDRRDVLTRAMKQEEEKLRALLEAAPDAMAITDRGGRLEFLNAQAEKMFGIERGQLVGEPMGKLVAEFGHGRASGAASQHLPDLAAQHLGATVAMHGLRKDGTQFPVEVRLSPIETVEGVFFSFGIRDITERKRTEEALQIEKAFTESIIDSMPDSFWVMNSKGRNLRWNKNVEKVLGRSSEELTAADPLTNIAEDERPLAASKMQEALAKGSARAEVHLLTKDGRKIPYLLTATRAVIGDEVCLVGVGIDITDVKRTEEALRGSEQFIREIIANVREGVAVYDPEFRYQVWNRYMEEMTGVPASEALGKHAFDLFPHLREQKVDLMIRRALAGEVVHAPDTPFRVLTTGKSGWVSSIFSPHFGANGEILGVIGIIRDVTERKRAETILQESEGRFRSLFENASVGIYRTTPQGRILMANPALTRMLGYEDFEELAACNLEEQGFEPSYPRRDFRERIERDGEIKGMEAAWTRRDGSVIFVRESARVVRGESGNVLYYDGIVEDITERKRAEEALREYEKVVEGSQDMIAVVDREYRYLLVNRAFLNYHARGYDTIVGCSVAEALGDGVFEEVIKKNLDQCFQGKAIQYEMTYTYPQLGERNLQVSYFPIEGPDGIGRVASVIRDISERKRAEEALRESEELYRSVVTAVAEGIMLLDRGGAIVTCNRSAQRILGLTTEELIGRAAFDPRWQAIQEDGSSFPRENLPFMITLRTGKPQSNVCLGVLKPDGTLAWILANSEPIFHAGDAAPYAVVTSFADITERKRAEVERARLVTAIEQSAEAVVITDTGGNIEYVNPAFTRITGYSREEALGQNPRILKSGKHDLAFYQQLWATIREGEIWHGELTNRRKDGSFYIAEMGIAPVRSTRGEITHYIATKEDVTKRKSMEAQLRQVLKMEAIGQLAGGVAHDFNNLLTIISGYGQLLRERLSSQDLGHMEEILKASDRAAALTRQLLAFSRRQILAPQVLDLNSVVANLEKMMGRLIGEHIELTTVQQSGLGLVKADPGQIEQVIINLAVNARDAMPGGGKLTIETANVNLDETYARRHAGALPGPYVMLAVSDTGIGMNAETLAHMFEPFFTTKEQGKGTGLGLATVYGIVKQSAGYISVYSEPGQGSTFKVYLPRVEDAVTKAESAKRGPELGKGSETVLVAEDEEGVRALVRKTLESYGYKVLEAREPSEALAIVEQYTEPIHLLLTDVVMPHMSGKELAKCLINAHPEAEVLYMSGYTDDAIVRHGVLEAGTFFLQKPFVPSTLLRKVREVLDAKRKDG